ncbi:Uncharacterised protein [Yersinia pseudotuberculosis]|uniref:Uncharacterized protein n=1 Tax=Yersinia pseudotuberculosis TaxID=633 RepID=A0A380Q9V4_YERPU|nr:Uncharacterised protein [Yersinia pseudotuberculosis]
MFLADSVLMYSDCAVIHLSNCADIGLERLVKTNVWSEL